MKRAIVSALACAIVSGCGASPATVRGPGPEITTPAPPPAVATPGASQPEMTPPASSVATAADDPTTTDGDKYKAILENEHTRVLRYHDVPGAKTRMHRHPASVVYALSSFRRRLSFPDGTSKERDFKAGDVMWLPAQSHIGENIGTTDTEVLLIEMRHK